MRLSVIIPAFDDLASTLACLNSLRAMQATADVSYYVQDDASPHVNLFALIPACAASVARNEVNLGFAGNANAGAARAEGDILFFVNQDINGAWGWSNGWDAALLTAFLTNETVGIVGARLLFPNGEVQNSGGVFDALCQPVHRYLGFSNPHDPRVSEPCAVDWTTGAALAIRRDVWERVGGFDTAYRMYWEDVDLCLRVREAGYDIFYEPRCTLIHAVGSTGGSSHFSDGARLFKQRWVDSRKISPGSEPVRIRYW